MRRPLRRAYFLTVLATVWVSSTVAFGQGAPADTVVLDTSGFWRVHLTLRTPVKIDDVGDISPLPNPCETPFPPADWRANDFDDSTWLRIPGAPLASVRSSWANVSQWNVGGIYMHDSTAALGLVSMRGKFRVDDPAKVDGLSLSIAYRGGAVAYLNGKEIARGNLPKGELTPETTAETYPDEVYLYPDGSLLNSDSSKAGKVKDRYLARIRHLENVKIPGDLLRAGVNVLAIEIHRSPIPASIVDKLKEDQQHRVAAMMWDHCGLHSVRLSASNPSGLISNVTRPKGMQAWSADALRPDFDLDFSDPNEKLQPVRIVATRNGVFSGKVVVGSTEPLKKLSAKASDLAAKDGAKISASSIRVRYARPDGAEEGASYRYPASAARFDSLDPAPPGEVPVYDKDRSRDNRIFPGQPQTVSGAVQPIWLTLKVPADATAGEYVGTLTVSAEGIDDITVPVHVKVHGWRMPDPKDFRTFVEVIQSPDSLSLYYEAPAWSDEHFRLIEESFKLLAEAGNRTVYVPLICGTNLGNEETMVRWVKKADGTYEHDFSIMDRYLDLYGTHLGRPEAVCVGVWETFLEGGFLRYAREGQYAANEIWEAFDKAKGLGPRVTLLDRTTRETKLLQLPLYSDAATSRALWKPLCDELTKRMKTRGWDKQVQLGYPNDSVPTKEVVDFFRELMPGVSWLRQAHSDQGPLEGTPYGLHMLVWSPRFLVYPESQGMRGWKRPLVQFPRNVRNNYPLTTFRLLAEMNVMGSQRGFGRLGADFWPVLKDKRGNRSGLVANRYPETRWRNLSVATSMLAPGKTGPLSTVRFEMLREGIEETEARIFIEEALDDETKRKALGDDLAARCEAMLRERTLAILQGLDNHNGSGFLKPNIHGWWNNPGQVGWQWYLSSDAPTRAEKLYSLAAEAAAKLEKKP